MRMEGSTNITVSSLHAFHWSAANDEGMPVTERILNCLSAKIPRRGCASLEAIASVGRLDAPAV
jgi:hypothetical protein